MTSSSRRFTCVADAGSSSALTPTEEGGASAAELDDAQLFLAVPSSALLLHPRWLTACLPLLESSARTSFALAERTVSPAPRSASAILIADAQKLQTCCLLGSTHLLACMACSSLHACRSPSMTSGT